MQNKTEKQSPTTNLNIARNLQIKIALNFFLEGGSKESTMNKKVAELWKPKVCWQNLIGIDLSVLILRFTRQKQKDILGSNVVRCWKFSFSWGLLIFTNAFFKILRSTQGLAAKARDFLVMFSLRRRNNKKGIFEEESYLRRLHFWEWKTVKNVGGVENEVKISNENNFGKQKKRVAKMKDKKIEHLKKLRTEKTNTKIRNSNLLEVDG